MIYIFSEHLASLADSIIMVLFLVLMFSFRGSNKSVNFGLCGIFIALLFADITTINHYIQVEGILAISYFIILFLFCRIALNGEKLLQMLMILIENIVFFLINIAIMVISMHIIGKEFEKFISMRNPTRIFLLFLSKILIVAILCLFIKIENKSNIYIQTKQIILSIFILAISILSGCIVGKMALEKIIGQTETLLIFGCFCVILILVIILVVQFSIESKIAIEKSTLQTRLEYERNKLEQMMISSESIRALQHDMDNHIIILEHYIKEENYSDAMLYLDKIREHNRLHPSLFCLENTALNAILDAKRQICKSERIEFKCYLQKALHGADDFTLSTILGNLLDNAIEAERKEKQKEIRLSIEDDESFLHIIVQNRIHEPILVNGKMPKSTKKNPQKHGLGLRSVYQIVTQAEGTVDLFEQNGWLVVDVLLPCKAEEI